MQNDGSIDFKIWSATGANLYFTELINKAETEDDRTGIVNKALWTLGRVNDHAGISPFLGGIFNSDSTYSDLYNEILSYKEEQSTDFDPLTFPGVPFHYTDFNPYSTTEPIKLTLSHYYLRNVKTNKILTYDPSSEIKSTDGYKYTCIGDTTSNIAVGLNYSHNVDSTVFQIYDIPVKKIGVSVISYIDYDLKRSYFWLGDYISSYKRIYMVLINIKDNKYAIFQHLSSKDDKYKFISMSDEDKVVVKLVSLRLKNFTEDDSLLWEFIPADEVAKQAAINDGFNPKDKK